MSKDGIAEAAAAVALPVAAKVPNGTVFPNQAVAERFPETAGLSELDMAPDLFRNRSWILAKLTADTFKRFLFRQPLINDWLLGRRGHLSVKLGREK